jgi:hypothetical protein
MGTTRETFLGGGGGGVFVAVLLVLLQGASVGEAMTTDASQTAILNRFNELRAAFGVAAYTWDDTAEGVAQGTSLLLHPSPLRQASRSPPDTRVVVRQRNTTRNAVQLGRTRARAATTACPMAR